MEMAEKKQKDIKEFIENVNKSKEDKRNGLKIEFSFVSRKRKG